MNYLIALLALAADTNPSLGVSTAPGLPVVCVSGIEALGIKKQKIDLLDKQLHSDLSDLGIVAHRIASRNDMCPIPCQLLPDGRKSGDLRFLVSVVRVGTVLQWTAELHDPCEKKILLTRTWTEDAGAAGIALREVLRDVAREINRVQSPMPVSKAVPSGPIATLPSAFTPQKPLPSVEKSVRPAPFVAWGLGVAGLVVGVVFGVKTMNDKNGYDRNPESFTVNKRDAMSRHQLTANAGYGTALLGAGVGTLLWFWD